MHAWGGLSRCREPGFLPQPAFPQPNRLHGHLPPRPPASASRRTAGALNFRQMDEDIAMAARQSRSEAGGLTSSYPGDFDVPDRDQRSLSTAVPPPAQRAKAAGKGQRDHRPVQ